MNEGNVNYERDPDLELALRLSLESNEHDFSSEREVLGSQHNFPGDTAYENRKRSFELNDHEIPPKKSALPNEDEDYQLALKLSKETDSLPSTSRNVEDRDYQLALELSKKSDPNREIAISCETENDYLLALKLSQEDAELVNIVEKDIPRNQSFPSSIVEDRDYQLALELMKEDDPNHASIVPYENENEFLLAIKLSQEDFEPAGSMKKNSPSIDECKSSDKNKKKYSDDRISVVDPSWEIIDPNPDIYSLFAAFNKRFFWSKLDMVEVKWSPRMTLCAGVCSYSSRAGFCSVRLSKPLLQYRPRKDLVETLLHEMIHAFLFVTRNDRDRDGHGPQFLSHMSRINKESGANITVYHSFHEEVNYFKTHWWKCDGPCQHKHPFYGLVKRSMNRAPGPNDSWWNDHRATCSGSFIKIKEPEGFVNTSKKHKKSEDTVKVNSLDNYFKPKTPSIPVVSKGSSVGGASPSPLSNPNLLNRGKQILGLVDLNTNNNRSSLEKNSNQNTKLPDTNSWAPLPGQKNIFQFLNKS